MKKIFQACMITLLSFPVLGFAQIELMAVPTNITIHVAEPVSFDVTVRNCGNSSVSGFFILNGRYDGFSIEVRKMGDKKSHRFANAVMLDSLKDDMIFEPVKLMPSEELSVNYVLLYNVRTEKYIFDVPGEYEVHFRLRWSQQSDDNASVTVHVTVLDWDTAKEDDKKQHEALALWKNREIADFVQDNAELSRDASLKLQELKEKFTDTLYGKLASEYEIKGIKGSVP